MTTPHPERRLAVARFASLTFVALALAPALAHLMELPAKMTLDREGYLTVQEIYRGWDLLGIVVLGALVSTLTYAVFARKRPAEFRAALGAFLCIAGTQAVFWWLTFPMNKATDNWTTLPAQGWEALRQQWEYSHAAASILGLTALVLVIHAATRAFGERP